MNHAIHFRPAAISIVWLIAVTLLGGSDLFAIDLMPATQQNECHFRKSCESASLIRSLHYKMVFRSPEFIRELEFWQKDSKSRAQVSSLQLCQQALPAQQSVADCSPLREPQVNDNPPVLFSTRRDGPSPLPLGLLHHAQFGWLFEDASDCRWSLVQDFDVWKTALGEVGLCVIMRLGTVDGLSARQLILHQSKVQGRVDIWMVESLGMYPMKIECFDPRNQLLSSSVVEKYETVQAGDHVTIIPTLIRELRTSPNAPDDTICNILEIVDGSLEINPDLPDELFAVMEETAVPIVETKIVPIQQDRHNPRSIQKAFVPSAVATTSVIATLSPPPASPMPTILSLIPVAIACGALRFGLTRDSRLSLPKIEPQFRTG